MNKEKKYVEEVTVARFCQGFTLNLILSSEKTEGIRKSVIAAELILCLKVVFFP